MQFRSATTTCTFPVRPPQRHRPHPDGRALLIIQSVTGLLFRVDPSTGIATKVDLGGALLTAGDGLLLSGRTLFVVQNRLNQVAVVRLNSAGTAGR